jgi:hypothetical protein
MNILAFEAGDEPEAAVVAFESYAESVSAPPPAILGRDGTLHELAGHPVKASFSADDEHRFVILTERSGAATLWSREAEPRRLATFGGLARSTWDPNGRWLQATLANGESYLVDLAWLAAIHGPDRTDDVAWLEGRVCEGPARLAVDDATLATSLGGPPRSCRH